MKRILLAILAAVLLFPVFSAAAGEGQTPLSEGELPGELRYVLEDGAFVQAVWFSPCLYVMTEDADGLRRVTVF